MCLVKILIRLRNAQAYLNIRCTYISEGTISDVAAQIICKVILSLPLNQDTQLSVTEDKYCL